MKPAGVYSYLKLILGCIYDRVSYIVRDDYLFDLHFHMDCNRERMKAVCYLNQNYSQL